jgi:pyruvate/2-oxoglutarate dehydrogenase complex dihydrolipoamide dehydrogenase (E3) component
VMQRMRERRAGISPHDSAARLRGAGVDVYFGEAAFAGADAVSVGGRPLRFRRAVIATGGRPEIPDIPGLAARPHLTSETLFDLTELPATLLVVGAGPIGCEMAQAFARLGSRVTLIDRAARILPKEDEDAAAIIARQLTADGVTLRLGRDAGLERGAGFESSARLESGAGLQPCDHILVAAGRTPNIDRLNLAAAGITCNGDGVVVDDHLRTTNRRVYAAGDVCSRYKFTHAADALARIVIRNALFFGRARASALVIPWCTYTDPEVAHVGAYDGGETITIPLADVDRAIVDDERDGFVRVHHDRGRLRGCTIVASRAGEMIGVVTHAMTRGDTLADLGATIHPYPTLNNAFRAAGDAYGRARLTPVVRRMLQTWMRMPRR